LNGGKMDSNTFFKSYWKYFLELEESLLILERYINFEKNNWNVYSNEFIKLLDVIGSEVDVVAKEIVLYKNTNLKKVEGIAKWGYFIQLLIPDIEHINLIFNSEDIVIPWRNWENEKYINKNGIESYRLKKGKNNPEWWISYNKVKHERTKIKNGKYNYERANLENVINALGGLYILETYFMEELFKQDGIDMEEYSKLFSYKNII
jgi:hypothetical protein